MKISLRYHVSAMILCASIAMFCSFPGCTSQKPFQITNQGNPWNDSYLNVAAMQSYGKWGTYNVHDPSCLLIGDTYYMFSTDAILGEDSISIKQQKLPFGYIQVRKSKDLVHWEFGGWVFSQIPQEAQTWVLQHSGGTGASNIWAPYIVRYKNKFRLYFSVSAFGKQTSYIGLAEANSPDGQWHFKGCVVKTKTGDAMNAIDPSVVSDALTGEQWLHYGSYFGGLYAVKLNVATGFTEKEGDQGQLTARRFNGAKNNIEAPEIIYNPKLKKYFLFVSYDPLMTTYNMRVGRADNPEGPFSDYFGKDFRGEDDNYPILSYPYQFQHHPGWAGTGHCSVFEGKDGNFYMAHQARLSPENHQMVLHVRKIFWTEDGWPVLSPERIADNKASLEVSVKDIAGDWEVISIQGKITDRKLEAGQILWGENHLLNNEVNRSQIVSLGSDYSISGALRGKWKLKNQVLHLFLPEGEFSVTTFSGHDWENGRRTILFTGIDKQGHSFWGKRIK